MRLALALALALLASMAHAEEPSIAFDDPEPALVFRDDAMLARLMIEPAKRLTFTDGGKLVGAFDWSTGTLRFEGNVDASAAIFFDYFWRHHAQAACGRE